MSNRRASETFLHERKLRDAEQVREGVDAALEVGETELDLAMEIDTIVELDGDLEKALSKWGEAMNSNGEFIRRNRQLMLRLHRHDLIVQALEEYRTELFQVLESLYKIIDGDAAYEDEESWEIRFGNIAKAHAKVIDTAAQRLGNTLADRKK